MFSVRNIENQYIEETMAVKPEYLIDSYISGNKYRKLKFNIETAKKQNLETILTFGGAYSNHIAAVAAAGNRYGFKTIGVIRGEELVNKISSNSTLVYARSQGMQFHFISREDYRNKTDESFKASLKTKFGDFYLIPEGGQMI